MQIWFLEKKQKNEIEFCHRQQQLHRANYFIEFFSLKSLQLMSTSCPCPKSNEIKMKSEKIDAIKSCHRTATNRFRIFFDKMKERGVSELSFLPRVIDLHTSKQQQQQKRQNRKFNERTMSSCHKQKVSEIREKINSESSTRKHHRSSTFYVLCIFLTFCVESSLCNSPPRFVLESSNAEVVGGDIVVRLKEGEETPPGSKIYSLKGFDSDGDRLLFGVQKGRDSDLIKVVNQVLVLQSFTTLQVHQFF